MMSVGIAILDRMASPSRNSAARVDRCHGTSMSECDGRHERLTSRCAPALRSGEDRVSNAKDRAHNVITALASSRASAACSVDVRSHPA